jgi:hypothetical protein
MPKFLNPAEPQREEILRISQIEQSTIGGSLPYNHPAVPIVEFVMNTKLLLFCLFATTTAFAADTSAEISSTATTFPSFHVNTDPAHWDKVISRTQNSPVIALGKSDFAISGPLVEGFRPLHSHEDLSLGQKFLRLPIIRLVVPGPMENPPGGTGKYFAWKNCSQAWPQAASRPGIGKGTYNGY